MLAPQGKDTQGGGGTIPTCLVFVSYEISNISEFMETWFRRHFYTHRPAGLSHSDRNVLWLTLPGG